MTMRSPGPCTAMRLAALLCAAAAVALALAAPAPGFITPAVPIDGPSPDIVGFGGVAMASDGSGGAVYLKRVGGVPHVFVAQFLKRRWQAPVQVDAAIPFAGSEPRIGAAPGGLLVAVWAAPFASVEQKPVFRLYSAVLDPGSQAFSEPIPVDRNIGTGQGASPEIALSSSGNGYIVYRVVRPSSGRGSVTLLRPGDVSEEVRVARFGGERWSVLGAINRNRGASMRPPAEANAPRIAITSGGAVVVWQEPDASGAARIWARRVFGSTLGEPLAAGTPTLNGRPLTSDADAPALAVSRFGQAEVAYRQQAVPAAGLPAPRVFMNVLPDGEGTPGNAFLGALEVEPAPADGQVSEVGRPAVDVDAHRELRLLYDAGGTPAEVQGAEGVPGAELSLGPAFTGSQLAQATELAPVTAVNPAGGGLAAWPSVDAHGKPALAVREDFPDGSIQTALVSGPTGGAIGAIGAGRSGLGDGLVAFQQGPAGAAAIAGARISAPPAGIAFTVSRGWVPRDRAHVEWSTASSAVGSLTYSVVLDGHPLPTPEGAQAMLIAPTRLPEGVHTVQMLVTDADGQSLLTRPTRLLIGTPPPQVAVSASSASAVVSVRAAAARFPVNPRSVRVQFGDGRSASGRTLLVHRYARRGSYRVTVAAATARGSRTLAYRIVRVR